MKNEYPEIPDRNVVLEEESLTTFENAEEVERLMLVRNFRTVALLTVGFHLPRSLKVFKSRGIEVSGFASEKVLRKNPAKHEALVKEYLFSESHWFEVVKEWLWRGLLSLGLLNLSPFRAIAHRVREKA